MYFLFMCFLVRIPEYVLYPSKCSLFFRACADKMTSTSGQNLASRENQRPGWGVKDFGAQLWALKVIPGEISCLVASFRFVPNICESFFVR